MLKIFSNYQGPLVVDILPKGATVTSSSYVSTGIPKLVSMITEKKPKLEVTTQFCFKTTPACTKPQSPVSVLSLTGLLCSIDPPYSPDLAPCDFWLFPNCQVTTLRLPFFTTAGPCTCNLGNFKGYSIFRIPHSYGEMDISATHMR